VNGTIRFLKNLTGLWALQECVREWGDADWATLEREARAAPAGSALVDLEDPRFLARGGMAERLRAWCREHGQPVPESRGQLVRVILESIAHSYRKAVDDLRRVTGQRPEVLHVFGGGSQNRLLCQFAADACAMTVVAGPAEATALGNLLVQARTMGDLREGLTIRDVAARSSALEVFTPTLQSD
jgi:rhamnulokinase